MTWTDWLTFWDNEDDEDETQSGLSDATQRAVQTIVSKIDELSSRLQDRISDSEERIDEIEESLDDIDQDVDYEPDVTEDDFEALKNRVDELEETINGFTEVYEAMSSQYNPLIDQGQSQSKAQSSSQTHQAQASSQDELDESSNDTSTHQEKPSTDESQTHIAEATQTKTPKEQVSQNVDVKEEEQGKTPNRGSESQTNEERNITIKDSLTDEKEEFTLGEEPSRSQEERRKQELQRSTDDDVEPRSKEDSVEPVPSEDRVDKTQEPRFGPEHASKHTDNPKLDTSKTRAQDTTDSVTTEQRQQPTRTSTQDDQEDQPQAQQNRPHSNNGSVGEPSSNNTVSETTNEDVRNTRAHDAHAEHDEPHNTAAEQNTQAQAEQRTTMQNDLIHQLIDKKRKNKAQLTTVADDEEFYVDGHQPLTNLLDLATVLTDDESVFKHHVLKERNFEAWIENSLDKPGLAEELRHIRSREDYITTLLAAE